MKIQQINFSGIESKETGSEWQDNSYVTLSQSFKVDKVVRGKTKRQKISLTDNNLVEFVFKDDSTWLSSKNTIDELFPEELRAKRGSEEFTIPTEISLPTDERGGKKTIALKLINILTKKTAQLSVKNLAISLEDKHLENKTGLFRLSPTFELLDFDPLTENKKTFCLLIHGTNSSTEGSFGTMRGTPVMHFLQENYTDRILAFQHRTLSENPLQNVKNLVQQLPEECTLHLITTSRGGLVGEVLSRFCNSDSNEKGFTEEEVNLLRKKYPKKYFETLWELILDIKQELSARKISIEKYIRIACPASGTSLVSKRLDNFLNITLNLIGLATGAAASPVFIATKNLICAIIDTKNQEDVLPGVEVQRPNSPFIQVLNGEGIKDPIRIDNSLAVISGDVLPKFNFKAVLILASKIFFKGRENDLVVNTVSMSMGTKRTGKMQEFFYDGKDIDHFKYFSNESTNDAILRALKTEWGKTLSDFDPVSVHKKQRRDLHAGSDTIEDPLLALERTYKKTIKEEIPVQVSISKGDLKFSSYPLLAGHFEDDSILYVEKYIDSNLGGLLTKYKQAGNYPGRIKDSRVFLTYRNDFKGAVIVGLGKPETLTTSELTRTIESGVFDYLFDLKKNKASKCPQPQADEIGISSLLIGSGYGGLTIENSISAIIQGVHNANSVMHEMNPDSAFIIRKIEFVEVYEDKAVNCLFIIDRIASETGSYKIEKAAEGITNLLGARKRIPIDMSEEWWNRLTVIKGELESKTRNKLTFFTSTQSARMEEQELYTTPTLIDETIEGISTNDEWNERRAKTIFELLIPNDFKAELKRHGNIVWVLDEYTATYPWELLQDDIKKTKPICISAGMIRQLKTPNYSKNIKMVSNNKVLVVADPNLDGFLNQLPGARKEGEEVKRIFEAKQMPVQASFGEKPADIIEKMFGDEYKIIHLSGHGVFNKDPEKGSGMVIGKNAYLSTNEIKQMSNVPEFVFINCCHLGKTDGVAEEYYQQRFKLAANLGTQLILNGVKCVIAAGWAVNDRAALEFARVFYAKMNDGETFGKAVQEARKSIYNENSNTWGAYQAYGDPFYRFRKQKNYTNEKSYLISQEAELDLENLQNAIEIGTATSEYYLGQLNTIIAAADKCKVRNPKITELEADICKELREFGRAFEKYRKVLQESDSSVSFTCFEKYQNVRAKKIVEEYKNTRRATKKQEQELTELIREMKLIVEISPSAERINILGSSFKRKAFLTRKQSELDQKIQGYEQAAFYYHAAYNKYKSWYSLTNWLTLEAILILAGKRKWEGQAKTSEGNYQLPGFNEAHKNLIKVQKEKKKAIEEMSYWDMVTNINIMLCRYILNFSEVHSQNYLNIILKEIQELWEKAGSKGKRFAEIEHFEFVIDALSMEQNELTSALLKDIKNIKKELEDLLAKNK